jgi:hypothetical protein
VPTEEAIKAATELEAIQSKIQALDAAAKDERRGVVGRADEAVAAAQDEVNLAKSAAVTEKGFKGLFTSDKKKAEKKEEQNLRINQAITNLENKKLDREVVIAEQNEGMAADSEGEAWAAAGVE